VILETVLLALAWVALTGDRSLPALVFASALAWLLLRLVRPLGGEGLRRVRLVRLPGFLLYVLKEVVVANLRWRRRWSRRRAVAAGHRGRAPDARPRRGDRAPRQPRHAHPGTLSLDVSPDRRTLYVHAMAVTSPDDLRREIRDGFERRILEVFR